MKYKVEIVKLGETSKELMEAGMVIIFNENAPAELAEISVLHTIAEIEGEVEVGDTIKISGIEYKVTAVGDEANKTLKQLGHCTFKFNGLDTVDLPGVINLEDKGIPEIKIGSCIEIY